MFLGHGPGELFIGLSQRGRALDELIATTYLDLARRRRIRFTVRFGDDGVPFSTYESLGEPLREGELDDAADAIGIPRPVPAAPAPPARSSPP